MTQRAFCLLGFLFFVACGDNDFSSRDAPVADVNRRDTNPVGFVCETEESQGCEDPQVFVTCERDGEFFLPVRQNCASTPETPICDAELGCVVCARGQRACRGEDVIICNDQGSGFEVVESCDIDEGFVCDEGYCVELCEQAARASSYQGCDFLAVDLDNAAIPGGSDASFQQYAVVVSNSSPITSQVWIEVNDAQPGETPVVREVARESLLPGDLWTFNLPRREVDGSSSNLVCDQDNPCAGSEVCVCGEPNTPCFCRVSEDATGLNDGTHSAITSRAYRVRSTRPIVAYQFNPLANVDVFSNDASILFPRAATGREYHVVGWPQTIADGNCDPADPRCAEVDFNTARDDEDLRAFLTIAAGEADTRVSVDLGQFATRVWRPGTRELLPTDEPFVVTLGAFDVLNLETDGLNEDFTGTIVSASKNVSVFTGSEASDAPRFDTYATRLCCADHLEHQLPANRALGRSYYVARMPPRTVALNAAFTDPRDSVAEVNELEYVRVQALTERTTIETTLAAPQDRFVIEPRGSVLITADQDFFLRADQSVSVLQVIASQQAVGISNELPGGDPAIVSVPPVGQYRDQYVFLTPDQYAFDFVVITAPYSAQLRLDGRPLDPNRCTISPADGIARGPGDSLPDQVIYRCQLSFPEIGECEPGVRGCEGGFSDGEQNDGTHTLVATEPVGLVVYGFDAFVSYAYVGGLNLETLLF